eukprot:TRINITY_DN869_c2_g1_i1.p1 TRINITY_DN869_c2_g1~~TRINITY_DN869_c2_g1_i1.p1  ORF type:complete len:167 (+),score=47.49 TRINITY_DN869_c2_g1_i1:140-640(+)
MLKSKRSKQAKKLINATITGDAETVAALLDKGADIHSLTDDGFKWTPLHLACREGKEDIVRVLLDRSADTEMKTAYGSTPLHVASKNGRTDIVRLLLGHKAVIDSVDNNGLAPLYGACVKGNDETARLLLDHGGTLRGKTPLTNNWSSSINRMVKDELNKRTGKET